ncbi:hypothetical protein EG68_07745 [Paragonimus skrjabini miyazakii]|uniref:Uncharacterized protein n=1 Tax=Paragonimus skrjabini miyazakii TaxID=59628 RepID=A0A8S9YLB2_9TREM|nr:hypothetical protein EG68_07745 [Paragonimus skrjabini miyazakii]
MQGFALYTGNKLVLTTYRDNCPAAVPCNNDIQLRTHNRSETTCLEWRHVTEAWNSNTRREGLHHSLFTGLRRVLINRTFFALMMDLSNASPVNSASHCSYHF